MLAGSLDALEIGQRSSKPRSCASSVSILAVADDAVQRGPQFVAHVREERAHRRFAVSALGRRRALRSSRCCTRSSIAVEAHPQRAIRHAVFAARTEKSFAPKSALGRHMSRTGRE